MRTTTPQPHKLDIQFLCFKNKQETGEIHLHLTHRLATLFSTIARELYSVLPEQITYARSFRPKSRVAHTTYHPFTKLHLSQALVDLQHDHQATDNALQQVVNTFTPLDIQGQQLLPHPEPLA